MGKEQKTESDQQFWQMAIETWQSSGLSVRQFCKNEGLTEPTFYMWRKKLTKGDRPAAVKQKESASSSAFIEVAMPSSQSAVLELVMVSGNVLRMPCSVDNKMLAFTLKALQEAGLC